MALQEATLQQQALTVTLQAVEASERVYVTGTSQINMLIPPLTQMWLFGQVM